MNLANLLIFIPLAIGVAWLFYLIFKQDLAAKSLGSILSYFLGVLIIVIVVGWLIDTMLPNWLNTRLQNAQTSVELREFVDSTTVLIEDSVTSGNSGTVILPAPTAVVIFPEATPGAGSGGGTGVVAPLPGTVGSTTSGDILVRGVHTVAGGETLSTIANAYGVSLESLRAANNRYTDMIFVGEQLNIPAETGK